MTQFVAFIEENGGTRAAFFDSDLHGSRIPDNAVQIAPARKQELLEAIAAGKPIEAAADGRPRISRIRAAPVRSGIPEREQIVQAVRNEASRRIEAISPVWRQINDLRHPTAASEERFAAIDAVRAACASIEEQLAATPDNRLASFPVANHPLWPEETA